MAYPRSKYEKHNFILDYKSGFVGRQPYIDPYAYVRYGGSDDFSGSSPDRIPDPAVWQSPYALGPITTGGALERESRAYARAYDKLIGRIRGESAAMLAVNAAERKQSIDMIAKRGTQLWTAYRQLRKFDLPGCLSALGFRRSRKRRSRNQWVRSGKSGKTYVIPDERVKNDALRLRQRSITVGDLWLEYWFGWKPLMSDIYQATRLMSGIDLPPTATRTVFTASGEDRWNYAVNDSVPQMQYYSTDSFTAIFGVRMSYRVRVNNPNIVRLNQLGLLNPLVVVWELIPFSFLVDWFTKVGSYLGSYTDTLGLLVDRGEVTYRHTCFRDTWTSSTNWSASCRSKAHYFRRSITGDILSMPGLFDRSGTGLGSLTRAATAVSLLTGQLKNR